MMSRLSSDQGGFTLVEMLVATAMGMVVILIISFLAVLTLRESSRVEGRVNATQNGRIVMYEIMDDLHSACIAPQIAPIPGRQHGILAQLHPPAGDRRRADTRAQQGHPDGVAR